MDKSISSAATQSPSIWTVAGNGTAAYAGDNQKATEASLSGPVGVAADSFGNIYIADEGNNRVRKVDPAGVITTIAPSEFSKPYGIAVDSAGAVYVADKGHNRVLKVDPLSADGITVIAYEDKISGPTDVAVDSAGNVYIAELDHHRVSKVDQRSPNEITTVADNLSQPYGVAVDSSGMVYIADYGKSWVCTVDPHSPSGQQPTTVADKSKGLAGPCGVAVDSAGNVYIGDWTKGQVFKVDTHGNITPVAGNGSQGWTGDGRPATEFELNNPWGVGADSDGKIYVADFNNSRVRRLTGVSSAATAFTVTPAGPPDVQLTQGGNIGYPGVHVHGTQPVPPQTIVVTLPPGRGLEFVAENGPLYEVTVQQQTPPFTTRSYDGELSSDGQTLTFRNVDLALSPQNPETAVWVAVRAAAAAPAATTNLTFVVGDRSSESPPIHVAGSGR